VAIAPTLISVGVTPVVDGEGPVVVVTAPVVVVVAVGEFEHAVRVSAARSEMHPAVAKRRTAVHVMIVPPCVV
jgi:hypothetical protein